VVVIHSRGSVPLQIVFAFKEPATTTENRMASSVAQAGSQVIHTAQPNVAVSTSKGINHITGEWVDEARNIWLIWIERGSQMSLRIEHTYSGYRSSQSPHRGCSWDIERWSGAVRGEVARAREAGKSHQQRG